MTAKGLEFRTVANMACNGEVIPFQECIEIVSKDTDLKEVEKQRPTSPKSPTAVLATTSSSPPSPPPPNSSMT